MLFLQICFKGFYYYFSSYHMKVKSNQGLARPGFKFRDRECLNPSLNIETETMYLVVSVLRPRLGILVSRSRLRPRSRLNAIICEDIWTKQKHSM
jgi:hypothetical protein